MSRPSDDEAKRLLRALPPLGDTDAMQERVRHRLDANLVSASWFVGRKRVAAWASGLGLALAAVAAAAFFASSVGHESASPTLERADRPPVARASAVRDAAPSENSVSKARSRSDAPQAPTTPSGAHSPARSPAAPPTASGNGVVREATPSNLVYQAATALRRDGNPQAALELLDQYARTSPRAGASEEAQALRMEAYYRLGSTQAEHLAESYLKSFPAGRFRQSAENILRNRARTNADSKRP